MFSSLKRLPLRKFTLFLAAAGVILAGALYMSLFGDLPAPDALVTRSSHDTTKIYDRNGQLLYEILDPRTGRRTRVSLDELPLNLQHAVIAVEDGNFYEHPGVDLGGIARALWQDIQARRIVAGGSTITQQLARDLLLSKQESQTQSLLRKVREAVLALRLTQAYPKSTILEMYLNETYFGNLAYGVEAASRTYFSKPARDLDLAECALLAGMIQSPPTYNPLVNFDAARARQKVVLDLMAKRGYISQADAQVAYDEPLHFKVSGSEAILRAPHFVAYVRNLLEQQYGAEAVNAGGLNVVTTLDLNLQERAQQIVKYNVSELGRRTHEEGAPDYNLHDAALVALDPNTGEILAMVGSADYFDDTIDGAVNVALSNRQPGSAIKPITYATAFAEDYTPATVLSDVPTTFQTKEHEPYAPQNYDQTWHGPISLRTALATSSNMVAVKVLDHVGLDAMIRTAKAMGITTFDDSDRFGLALTLGGGEVKLLELTAAYAAFAHQGQRVEPNAILSVTENEDRTTEDRRTQYAQRSPQQAVSPQVAYLITNILSDNRARIPAFGEDSLLNLSRPAAAKTGTTTDFRDNWTVGYTPDLAVGVWAGNANNDPMYKISGITGAAPIWHDFMEEAFKAIPPRDFERPDGILDADVCETSGLLPTKYCPRVRSEVFLKGTEPQQPDDTYQPFEIDSATGLLWTDDQSDGPNQNSNGGCKGTHIERVFRLFPPDAQEWALKQRLPQPPEENCLGQPVTARGETHSTAKGEIAQAQTPLLLITSPAENSTFELSPQLPPEVQQIQVSARLGSYLTMRQVTLAVDGQVIGTFSSLPYRALWRLTAGAHQAQAIGTTREGQQVVSPVVRFMVTASP